jgi:tripartite-type tricarboxylate transporter receptor subunit TctC
MNIARRQFLQFVGAAAAGVFVTLSGHAAWSQAAKTIKIVVPFPPGGPTDFLARLLAEQGGQAQGPTMVVENRPGASAVIGTEAASRATPDGTTLLINSREFVINPYVRKVNYHPLTSFEPICQLVSSPTVISVNSASPYRTLADLVGAARARPGELTLAGGGPGSPIDIGFAILRRAANVDMTFVPYPGGAPAITALLGEHVTSTFTAYATVAEQLKAGKLRALASASPARIEALPNLPTAAESGYKDFDVDLWYGLVAPAKIPKETVSQLADWFSAAMLVPDVRTKLVAQGLYPEVMCGAHFAEHLQKQYDEYGRAIRELNIKAE